MSEMSNETLQYITRQHESLIKDIQNDLKRLTLDVEQLKVKAVLGAAFVSVFIGAVVQYIGKMIGG